MGQLRVLKSDRLVGLQRIRDNGEVVFRGAEDVGACKVQIAEAQFGSTSEPTANLVFAHCNHQLVLCAQVRNWPKSVDITGKKISIWLHDYSFVRSLENPFLFREFILEFFTDFAAADFFKAYTSCLIDGGHDPGLSYEELQDLSKEKEENGRNKRKREDVDDNQEESDCNSVGIACSDKDTSGDGREDESDEEKRRNPFYDEDDYGESQNIYEEACVIKLPLFRGKRARMMALSDKL